MTGYPRIALSEALELDREEVQVKSAAEYKLAGVYSFGRGLFARTPLQGTETRYKSLNRLRAGQFVISRLKAFEGAVAIVPPRFDGWYLSQEFPTFTVTDRADSRYIGHLCRWPQFWELLQRASKGVGARRERVHPEQLFEIEVPLPDLDEQRRVASKLDRLFSRAQRASELAGRSRTLIQAAPAVLARRPELDDGAKAAIGWRQVTLGELIRLSHEEHSVNTESFYPNIGVLSFARGLFEKQPIDGATTRANKLFRTRAGQFIYSRLFAFEGAYAIVDPQFEGYFVSNEFPTFDVDADRLDADFLAAYFKFPALWRELAGGSKGLGLRRQRVHPERLLSHLMWLPPIQEQRRVASVLRRIEATAHLGASRDRHLEALQPSTLNRGFAGEL